MKSSILFVLICLGIDLLGQTGCSPNLKEIYNFEIGDVYNYKYINYDWSTGNGIPYINEYYREFEVKNKTVDGDTIIYIIDGYLPPTIFTQVDYNSFIERIFSDTLIIIDSSRHCLNLCHDSIVELHFFPYRDTIYTKVRIDSADLVSYKILGGGNNLYEKINNELYICGEYPYEERYAEKLGLIYQDFFDFEERETIELASYVKGGDTTILITSNVQPLVNNEVMVFPNPFIDNLHIQFGSEMGLNTILIYDSLGKIIYSKFYKTKVSSDILNISGLKNGIYLLIINADGQKIIRKIVKYDKNNYY